MSKVLPNMPSADATSLPQPGNSRTLASRSAPSHLSSKLGLLFAIIALLGAGLAAGRQVWHWPARLRYPGALDTAEGTEFTDMVMLRRGRPVYATATPENFNAVGYGPLFYLLGSRLVSPQKPGYLPMRLIGLLGVMGLAAACALLAFWLSRSWVAAALAPLLWLSYTFTTLWGVAVHPDSVALFLWFGGFLVAYRFRNDNKILLATPLMVVGVFYKGQFIVAFLAVVSFLALERRYRLAAVFAAIVVGGTAILFALFQFVIFRQQAFWLHFLVYNAIPFHWQRSLWFLGALAIIFAAPVVAAVWFLRAHKNKLLACYFIWALVLPAVTLAKMGSGANYYFELILLFCPIFSALIAENVAIPSRAALLLAVLGVTVWLAGLPRCDNPQPLDFAQDRAEQAYLRHNFPPRAPALGIFTGDLLRAGLDTPIANLYQYSWLVCTGKLPAQAFSAQFGERRFRVILLNLNLLNERAAHDRDYMCLTETARRAILQNYRLDATFRFHIPQKTKYYAWVPR